MGNPFMTGFAGSVGDALQKKLDQQNANDQKQKDAQAQIYLDAIRSGRLSPDQITYSLGQVQKIYGNSKPMKEILAKVGGVFGQLHDKLSGGGAGGGANPAAGAQGQPSGVDPNSIQLGRRPAAQGGAAAGGSGAGSAGGATGPGLPPAPTVGAPTVVPGQTPGTTPPTFAGPSGLPAPPSFGSITSAAFPSPTALANEKTQQEMDAEQAEIQQRIGIASNVLHLKPGSQEWNEYVVNNKISPSARLQHTQMVDSRTGSPLSFDPDSGGYVNGKGESVDDGYVVTGSSLAAKNYHDASGRIIRLIGSKLYDLSGQELPSDTVVYPMNASSSTTVTNGIRLVPQPDGSIKEVPVTTTSTRTPTPPAGGSASLPAAPKSGGSGGSSAGPASPSSKSGRTVASAPPSSGRGQTVGGRIPTEVKKAFDTYSSAQERYKIMQAAVAPALHGNQQAMLNLLANHIGMTMGLQHGARITQAIYNEALESAPWLARVDARWGTDGYMSGVTLTPQQINQMMELAENRLSEDRDAWQREVQANATGYGTQGSKSTGAPSAPVTPSSSLDDQIMGAVSAVRH